MVQIIPAKDDWAKAFRSIGGGVSEGYMNRADENAIQDAIQKLGPNASMKDTLAAVTGTKTYSPQSKNMAIERFVKSHGLDLEDIKQDEIKRHHQAIENQKSSKVSTEGNDAKALINASKLPDEKKQEYAKQVDKGEISFKAVKELIKPEKTSDFQKKLAGKNVELYTKAVEDLPKSERTIQDLSKLEELNTKLAGPLGYFKALNPFNEDAAEMSALGFGILDTVVKMFNPVGPIAQKKLEQLQKQYAISPTDSSAKTKGKIRALKSYAERTKDIAKQRIDLFNKFDGMPPLDQIAMLDAAGNEVIDEMIKKEVPKVKYYSKTNGKELKDLTEDQIEKFTKEGLITDVKP